MKIITVTEGQNIYDISLQEYGDMSGAVLIIQDNPSLLKSFNTLLKGGFKLKINTEKIIRKDIVLFYRKREHRINTGEKVNSGGIGAMGIENDFIVG